MAFFPILSMSNFESDCLDPDLGWFVLQEFGLRKASTGC